MDPRPARTMFCLPYAGGGASAYTGLLRELAHLTVVPVQLPGRESRIAEPPAFTIAEIADEVAPATDEPYALYGHSMGARLAFEVVRELRRRGLRRPSRLYVGGAHPPDRRVPLAASVDLPDDAFIDQLVRRSGALPELKHMPELRELMMPVLRSDFTWIKNYAFAPEPPIDSPIVAFTGLDDEEVGAAEMLGWARHTTAGFRLRTLRGGHLFVKDRPAELAALIAADLAAEHALPEQDELHLWMGRTADHATVLRRYAGRAAVGMSHTDDLTLVAAVGTSHTDDPTLVAAVGTSHTDDPTLVAAVGTSHADGPASVLAAPEPGIGVSILRALDVGGPDSGLAELSGDEREQIEDAAEEDRRWLALRAVTAKRALMAAAGQGTDPAAVSFPDLADPGPWHAQCGPGLDRLARWRVVHLPLHTSRGEALGAVAVPHDRVRLRFDMPAEQAG
ncbi:surfactin synthase thioesterase subunit [Nonomuraea polychroma]|uniref:Surfactin synthase thioesterase subunit n=1 Tax=Nonomuraea polychroma TaxID=46176 RepID=A0A438LZT1_9ACTN|nr:thioesterase domain-containing protein [Nonomuraea polychroma]RVX39049.1 surfactin synthase thioesterase subunit [Nonomuraea polychroma]